MPHRDTTVNKRLKQLKSQKKLTGGDAPAIPPAQLLRGAKERASINRGKETKPVTPAEILRAKKKSIAKKKK